MESTMHSADYSIYNVSCIISKDVTLFGLSVNVVWDVLQNQAKYED